MIGAGVGAGAGAGAAPLLLLLLLEPPPLAEAAPPEEEEEEKPLNEANLPVEAKSAAPLQRMREAQKSALVTLFIKTHKKVFC